MASAIAKPQLRGFLKGRLLKHAIGVSLLSFVTVGSFKVFVKDARKQKYEDFFKNFDAQKDFERMRDAGVFRSVPPKK